MISTRGERYAKAGLADGYLGPPKTHFDKDSKQGVVSFSNAENVSPGLDSTNLTYHEGPFGSNRLRAAMANLMTTYFHPATPISPNNIVFANGVTSLNTICALSLTNPGDGILLAQPIYGSFTGDLSVPSDYQLIYTPFHGDDPFSPASVARYEETFLKARHETGVKIQALLICNPHNPLGRCYSRETLQAVLLFCQKYQIHLISDEIYALSVYGNHDSDGFVSILSIDPIPLGVSPALIHVLYGLSKDFAAAGLRLGCLISQNQRLLQAALSMSRFHWPSNISCSIATAVLEDREFVETFLPKSRQLLCSHRDLAVRALEEAGIPFAQGSVAGFFLWIDLSKCLDDEIVTGQGEWAAELDLSRRLQQTGVVMSSGHAYHNEVAGWFRVIFSVEVEMLKVGLSRITEFYSSASDKQI
ncbi:1-aminocyclopropane-1-carboxylate synthase 6 [Penicillium fimorum]|uniref:1-aminocyclopropane-1-carboxylate synthase 6 n=1 Tax=Penicillium fimorum TaxID=1882269 RepID=A0A9X0C3P2_9EURO|nr:1-aminocyclopropane-1-carboxylate synthase 6 [Penicillium fimorum]